MEHILACPSCNTPNRLGSSVCRACGQSLTYTCTRCNLNMDPGMAYCPYCGETAPSSPVEHNLVNIETAKRHGFALELS